MAWTRLRLPYIENPKLEFGARLLLGLIFLISSYHKLLDPQAFGKVLLGYELFPFSMIVLAANMMPFIEVVCGLSLVFGVWPKEGMLILIAMLGFFILVLALNLFRGVEHDCGCFSSEHSETIVPLWLIIIRNLILISIAYAVFIFKGERIGCLKE